MENQKEFNEKLNEFRKNTILEVSQQWGLKNPGYTGTLITKDREKYIYQFYINIPQELEDKKVNFISKSKKLNDDEFNNVIDFIKGEILNKDFKDEMIYDAGFNVSINYSGNKKTIKNNIGSENDLKIYDKAKRLIDKLTNQKV